jgi:hypothetical protein
LNGMTAVSAGGYHTVALRESRAVAVRLKAGYNLIALPAAPEPPLTAEALAQRINLQGGNCVSVIRYVSGAFETHPVGTAVSNFPIEAGRGYFARCAAESDWTTGGRRFPAACAPIALEAGYNLVGLPVEPDPPGRYTAEGAGLEINAQGGSATQLALYDAAGGSFMTHPLGTAIQNFTLTGGMGFFVRCASASQWTPSRR